MENKKILICTPLHFTDKDYQLAGAALEESIDNSKAWRQWRALVDELSSLGLKVCSFHSQEKLPDMVFVRDAGLVLNSFYITANFFKQNRKGEAGFYKKWFKDNKYKTIELHQRIFFEGGDIIKCGKTLLVGCGFRTSPGANHHLATFLSFKETSGDFNAVFNLRLINPDLFHLDFCLQYIESKNLIVYYPEAFDKVSLKRIEKLPCQSLKADKEDALNFVCNFFSYQDKVLVPARVSDRFLSDLESYNLKPIRLDVSEFKKAQGGIHCLCLEI